MILSTDYYQCKQTIASLSPSPGVLSKKIDRKLKFLQLLIESPDNTVESPTEFQHLNHLDRDSAIRLYIDTVTCLFPRKNNHVSNYIRKGVVFMKFKSLRNWKERILELNVFQRTLSIFTEFTQSSLEREYELSEIILIWLGFVKGKHCFSIQNFKKTNSINEFLLGHNNFNLIREWYELILETKISTNNDNFIPRNVLEQKRQICSDNEIERKELDSFHMDEVQEKPFLFKKTETMYWEDNNNSLLQLDEISTNFKTEEVKELIIPQIFHETLKNFNLEKLLEEDDYKLISIKESTRILQHSLNPKLFKVFFEINYGLNHISDDIIDLKNGKNWNKTIQEMKILNIIGEEENSYLVHEKWKPFGRLYWPRDFCYLQSFVRHSNILITIKKSINYANDKKYIRGNIKNFIQVLMQHPKSNDFTLGVLSIDIDNCGYFLSQSQQKALSLNYLKQYKNLNYYFAHKNFLRSIISHIGYYKLPIETNYKTKSPNYFHHQDSMKVAINEIKPLLRFSENTGNEALMIEETNNITSNKLVDFSFQNKKELNVIYEKSEESKSYCDPSVDKIIEKDLEDVLIKDTLMSYNDISPMTTKFPLINRNDYVKLLETIELNEHSIRSILKRYIMHPIKTKEKFQSIYPEHYIFNKDWVKLKDGGVSYHNTKNINNQKKIVGYLLRKIGKNLLSGKSIMNISMPIEVFDTTSFLERLAYSLTHVPLFLEKAAKTTDIIQQMNYVCAAFLSTLHMTISQIKPFNPILGETFQGWIKGCPIYLEQISHHPPISAFQLYGNGYILQGNFELVAELHPNSLTGKQLGLYEVVLKNQNRRFYFTIPTCDLNGGCAFGTRFVNYEGKNIIFNKEQCLITELNFNPDKKGFLGNLFLKPATPCDTFIGSTYKVTEDCMKRLLSCKPVNKFNYYGINKKAEVVEEINKVRGIWHEYLMIDDKKFWDIKEHVPYVLEYENDPLPSDSVYREDANVWKSGNVEKAQIAKEKLEEIQRSDRKWREKLGAKQKK